METIRTPPFSSVPEMTADRLLAESVFKSEKIAAIVRLVLFSLFIIRFFMVTTLSPERLISGLLPFAIGIIFSLYILLIYKKKQIGRPLLLASVAADGISCFSALLPNIFDESPYYYGIAALPETVVLLLIAIGAGFRLDKFVAIAGGGFTCALFLILITIDRAVNGVNFFVQGVTVSSYLLLFVAATILGYIVAQRTRRLATSSSIDAIRAQKAEENASALLRDHHDLRNFLSLALLNADFLASSLTSTGNTGEFVEDLQYGLKRAREIVEDARDRALNGLLHLDTISVVDVGSATEELTRSLATYCRERKVSLSLTNPVSMHCTLAGGVLGLKRILLNLILNAFEGDARGSARNVVISMMHDPGTPILQLRISDDGPGIHPEEIGKPLSAWETHKSAGSGQGMGIVYKLVQASGGTLSVSNKSNGGACVTIELPITPPSIPSN